MIRAIVFDFSRVILDVRDTTFTGSLNGRHKELKQTEGYNLFDHFGLNEQLLQFISKNIFGKYDLYIFTTGFMHNEPEIQEKISHLFKKMYNLEDTGFTKDNSEAFTSLSKLIGTPSEEILFIDDTEENISAAKNAGFQTIWYQDNEQLFNDLISFLNS